MGIEGFIANRIFKGPAERLEQRMIAGEKPTFKDLAVGMASDVERAVRFMTDPTYDVYATDYRIGGAAIWSPNIARHMWRNFLEARGGQNG